MKLAITLSLLAACGATSAELGDDPLPDGGAAGPDADDPDHSPGDASPAPGTDAAAPAGCTWVSTATGASIQPLADYAFTISSAGHRAIAYTAMVDGRLDVVVARGTTGFTIAPYGLSLIATNAYTDLSAAFTASGVLRVAYHNETVNGYEGGVYYAPTPGASVFVDGAGLLGRTGGTQLAIGPDGRAHIAYHVHQIGDERLAVATMTTNTSATIAPAMIDDRLIDAAIAVDGNNQIHVTANDYSDPEHMVYARTTGIGAGYSPIARISPAAQSNGGNLLVANNVVRATRRDEDRIIYARKGSNTAWIVQVTPFTATSLPATGLTEKDVAVDANGQLHFVWTDRDGMLVYERLGQPPVTIKPTGAPVVRSVQLALGPTGPQIAYATGSSFSSPWALSVARCE